MFSTCSPGFVKALVPYLELFLCDVNDVVIHEGDIGECMYFVRSGALDVLVNGDKVATLKEGSVLGEIALLQHQRLPL